MGMIKFALVCRHFRLAALYRKCFKNWCIFNKCYRRPKNVQFQNWSYKNPFPSFFLILSKFQSWKCWYWWELGCIFCKSVHKPSPHFPERKINKIFVVWKMLQYSCTLQIPEYYAILRLCKQMGFCMSFYILFLWKTAFFFFAFFM